MKPRKPMTRPRRKFSGVRSLLAVILILALGLPMAGCGVPSAASYVSGDRNTGWINDISYLETTLPKVHKNLYFHIPENTFHQELEDLKSKVPNYTDEQMAIALSAVIASIGDTHTGSNISAETMYPIELHWFSEGIYITGTNSDCQDLLNARIIALNGVRTEDAANALRPLFAGANDSWFKTQVVYCLTIPSILKFYGLSQSDVITLDVNLRDGREETVKLEPLSTKNFVSAEQAGKAVPLYMSHTDEPYWYDYLEEQKTVYLNYNSCSQMRNNPFEIFDKAFWDFVNSHNVDKLVVDIRENRGGNSSILDPFIKEVKKSALNQDGKLYVIIGKDTFSSAILNAVSFKKETRAIFIGEATGGEPNHYGDVQEFELPNSKITVRYSTKYFHWMDTNADTLLPDKEIPETFAAYMAGTDPVLDWIAAQK